MNVGFNLHISIGQVTLVQLNQNQFLVHVIKQVS
jgi:hypothetical protein